MQTTNTVLMIRPSRFSFNVDTAANNRFQKCSLPQDQAQAQALEEFDGYVAVLREQGVEVLVAQDSASPHTPDSIFPNNWWSSHADGTLVLYPMQGQNRRLERDKGVLEVLLQDYQHYGVEPDILTSAKSLGGGFPIGAMLTREGLAQHLLPGTHGTTYGGNPLGCAVAEAVFDLVSDRVLLDGVKQRAEQFKARLAQMAEQYGVFNEIRGLGLLIGCVLTDGWRGRAKEVLNAAAGQGLILLQAGPDVLRFAPSLIVSEADIVEGLDRFERTLALLTRAAD